MIRNLAVMNSASSFCPCELIFITARCFCDENLFFSASIAFFSPLSVELVHNVEALCDIKECWQSSGRNLANGIFNVIAKFDFN